MKSHELRYVQKIPCSLEEAWDFFSDPANLARITPPDMGFIITSQPRVNQIYPGQIISYQVRPLWGIPMTWMTEITHVNPGSYFVDEQRIGPYRLWHHQHHFLKAEMGIEMLDIVHYAVPLGVLGKILNALVIRRKLAGIFAYRRKRVEALFPDQVRPIK